MNDNILEEFKRKLEDVFTREDVKIIITNKEYFIKTGICFIVYLGIKRYNFYSPIDSTKFSDLLGMIYNSYLNDLVCEFVDSEKLCEYLGE